MLYPLSYGGFSCKGAGQTLGPEHTFGSRATSQLRLTGMSTA